MLGRALRLPLRSRLLASAIQCQHDFALPPSSLSHIRAYATPGRPKSVVGEPSRPVKRAVKKAVRTPTNGDSPAEQLVEAKKQKAGKGPTKNWTPEEKVARKERAKVATEKTKLNELKEAALTPPPNPRNTAYQVFMAENMSEKMKQHTPENPSAQTKRHATGRAMREVASEWKALSAAQLEHYNHIVVQKRESTAAAYKAWVESHTPDEIYRANHARSQLRSKLENDDKHKGKGSKWPKIVDERAVKRPLTGFALFMGNRHASGDFKHISLGERAKLIAQEWKVLSEDERKKYLSLQNQDRDRYVSEFKDTYGFEAWAHKGVAAAAA